MTSHATNDDIANAIQPLVDAGALAGAAAVVWRDHQIPQTALAGWRDLDARLPITRDTVFRIASLSKPVTTVAALMLLEEGRFALADPISRWAPEFGRMRVRRAVDSPLGDTVHADRPITFEDLLTHRAGFTYGAFWPGPLADAYLEALGDDIDSHLSPDQWIAGLATLPLIDQPGATLHYGVATDLLGLLIARIEGMTLGTLLERRIFAPLGMRDTGFLVPRVSHSRRAAAHGFDDSGRLIALRNGHAGAFLPERPDDMRFESGGAGLWSTLDDYLAFARLFIGLGAVDGVRLLRPETLALMTSNRLTPDQRRTAEVAGMPLYASGHGYGMGVAVVMEPAHAEPVICGGGAGAVGGSGAFGGWWRADPAEGSVRVFLAHNMIGREQFASGVGFGVYDAITRFSRLG